MKSIEQIDDLEQLSQSDQHAKMEIQKNRCWRNFQKNIYF
jgi:predicted DNA-binding protein (UPF0251 family)